MRRFADTPSNNRHVIYSSNFSNICFVLSSFFFFVLSFVISLRSHFIHRMVSVVASTGFVHNFYLLVAVVVAAVVFYTEFVQV